LVRQGGQPREHVGEFVGDLVGCAFAHRLGEFTDLFAEPGNRWGDPAVAVSVTVGVVDHLLEFAQVHTVTVPEGRRWVSLHPDRWKFRRMAAGAVRSVARPWRFVSISPRGGRECHMAECCHVADGVVSPWPLVFWR